MSKKIVVTGGAGFIGSHLVETLVQKNFDVTVIDNLFTGKKENLSNIWGEINFVNGSVLDSAILTKNFADADCVFHLGGVRSMLKSVEDPLLYNHVNIDGTLNVLAAARTKNVRRVIFASSSSIYGNPVRFPIQENCFPNPRNPYALSKLAAEYYCKMYFELFGLETISLRYFNVYGPRQDFSSQYGMVVPVFVSNVLQNKTPVIWGTGSQSRDFVYVSDIVSANLNALTAGKKAIGQSINVCQGKSVSVNQILETVNHLLHKDIQAKYTPVKKGDVLKTLGSPALAKRLLSFSCKVSFAEGMRKTIAWMKDQEYEVTL
ncbi:MAG: NAD-dependent epimerase/dehydratase family protein [Candidatus Diapherotrites archaeon]|nr:NAD-dependent epimerase/dehydratase family protein [Candidatus Diapherotrites archaeon]